MHQRGGREHVLQEAEVITRGRRVRKGGRVARKSMVGEEMDTHAMGVGGGVGRVCGGWGRGVGSGSREGWGAGKAVFVAVGEQ